jgi:hypothetical protein
VAERIATLRGASGWGLAEHDHVGELVRDEGQSERVRHAALVDVSFAGETEQRLNHVSEPLTGVISTRTIASRWPSFHQSCHTPGSMLALSPARTTDR